MLGCSMRLVSGRENLGGGGFSSVSFMMLILFVPLLISSVSDGVSDGSSLTTGWSSNLGGRGIGLGLCPIAIPKISTLSPSFLFKYDLYLNFLCGTF